MNYKTIVYKEKGYAICEIKRNNEKYYFIVDHEDIDKIKNINWSIVNGYIGMNHYNGNKVLFLHNLIMNHTPSGKGSTESIDHINRNTFDNRKKNLRFTTQTNQNINKHKVERKIQLPENRGVDTNDIPKCVYYNKSRDRFYIEISYDNKLFKKYFTGSQLYSLKFKLENIKSYLRYLNENYPNIYTDYHRYNYKYCEIKSLRKFNNILKNSGFNNFNKSLFVIPEQIDYLNPIILSDNEMKLLKEMETKYTF